MTPHIDSRHLYDVAQGTLTMEEEDRLHLRTCESCLELLRVFTRQKFNTPHNSKKQQNGGSSAA